MHSDYSTSAWYFNSEHVSGPCKNIHRLQPPAQQSAGPLIIPGLACKSPDLYTLTFWRTYTLKKTKLYSAHTELFTVGYSRQNYYDSQWENKRFLCGAGLHPRAFYRHHPGLNHTTLEMHLYSEQAQQKSTNTDRYWSSTGENKQKGQWLPKFLPVDYYTVNTSLMLGNAI